jgi:hypothetical protein
MFDIKLEGIDKALKQFDSKIVRRAAVAAINDCADGGKAETKRQLVAEYGIRPSKVAQYLKIVGAKQDHITATIIGLGKGLLLSYFKPKQEGVIANKNRFKYKGKSRARGGKVFVEVKGRKEVSGVFGNKPFVARMKTTHIGVYVRVTGTRMRSKNKEQIQELFGPGVGGGFGSKKVMDIIQKVIRERFPLRFEYWLNRYRGDAR